MTQPSPEGQSTEQGQGRPARKPRLLDVVDFEHHDVLLGRTHTVRGVIVRLPSADGETATVRPLAGHAIEVDPSLLTPLSAADVADS